MNGNRPNPHFWLERTAFLLGMWSIVVSAQQAILEAQLNLQCSPSELRH
jgi:hypothetical protein